MNQLATIQDTAPAPVASAATLLMNPAAMNALVAFAEMMARSAVTVPQHLQGKPADCMAIAMQAAQWGMNPFAVAQKTHIVSGRLGYEAQLVNAVVQASGAIVGAFHYEFRGDGANLECRVGAVLRGESEITWGEWLRNGDVQVKNSPLWKVNPKQQLGYLQVKNWARLYCPGAILGVYTDDELGGSTEPISQPAKDMGTITPEPAPGPRRKSDAAAATEPSTRAADNDTGEVPPPAPAAEPAAAPPQTSLAATSSGPTISANQVAYLRNKMRFAGVDEASIAKRFNVTGLDQLTAEQFDELKAELLQMA